MENNTYYTLSQPMLMTTPVLTTQNLIHAAMPTAAAAPPSYDAIALNPNGPRSRTNLFVRKLASAVVEQDLKALFVPFGEILSFALMRDIHTGESLGTAFVRYATHEQAKAAMAALDEKPLYGRPISIQWAKRQHDSTPVGEARTKIHKLFVRNIPLNVKSQHLRQLFGPYGTIVNVTLHADTSPANPASASAAGHSGVIHDDCTSPLSPTLEGTSPPPMEDGVVHVAGEAGATRNIAFVVFAEDGAADAAVEALHNTSPFSTCGGVPLMVKLAEDNRQRLERRQRFQQEDPAVVATPPNTAPPGMIQFVSLPSGAAAASGMPYMAAPILLPTGQAMLPSQAGLVPMTGSPTRGGSYFMTAPPMTASASATPGSSGQFVFLPTAGGTAQPYWLQPMATTSPQTAPVAVSSRAGTPPMMYAMAPQTMVAQPLSASQSYVVPVTQSPPRGAGVAQTSGSLNATTTQLNVPQGAAAATAVSPGQSFPSFFSISADNAVTTGETAPVGRASTRAPPSALHPQAPLKSILLGASQSNKSPVRRSSFSAPSSRVGLSMSQGAGHDSYELPTVKVSVGNSGAAPNVSANGVTPSKHATRSQENVRSTQRHTDASAEAAGSLTDVDTNYGSLRLDNSSNAVNTSATTAQTSAGDVNELNYHITTSDLSESQLLELARNMAFLEDTGNNNSSNSGTTHSVPANRA